MQTWKKCQFDFQRIKKWKASRGLRFQSRRGAVVGFIAVVLNANCSVPYSKPTDGFFSTSGRWRTFAPCHVYIHLSGGGAQHRDIFKLQSMNLRVRCVNECLRRSVSTWLTLIFGHPHSEALSSKLSLPYDLNTVNFSSQSIKEPQSAVRWTKHTNFSRLALH